MDIANHWSEIVAVANQAKRANRHFSIATVSADGNPHITPIGHVFFRDDMTAYYFDAYSKAMPKHFESNRRICLMAVNSSPWFWLKSLYHGEFGSAPALRLFGEVSEARAASKEEIRQLRRSIRTTRWLKGHKMLWGDLDRVRDIRFTDCSPAHYPVMCANLWK